MKEREALQKIANLNSNYKFAVSIATEALKEPTEPRMFSEEEVRKAIGMAWTTSVSIENANIIIQPLPNHKEKSEEILCAAIWFQDAEQPIHTVANVEGLVLCGYRHGHIIGQITTLTGKRMSELGASVQGFLTNKNRFIDRVEAHKLFKENGGTPEFTDELYSEDLYSLSPKEGKEEVRTYTYRELECFGIYLMSGDYIHTITNNKELVEHCKKQAQAFTEFADSKLPSIEPNQTEAEKDEFRQLYDWLLHNGTYLDADEKTIIYYEELLFAKMNEIRSKSVGDLLEGEHPDEIYPRAGSWLQERRNWAAQVKQLEEYASLARKQVIEEIEEWAKFHNYGQDRIIFLKDLLEYIKTLKP